MANDMNLPQGFTCQQCAFLKKCAALGIIDEQSENTMCDFSPSNFRISLSFVAKLQSSLTEAQEEIKRLRGVLESIKKITKDSGWGLPSQEKVIQIVDETLEVKSE